MLNQDADFQAQDCKDRSCSTCRRCRSGLYRNERYGTRQEALIEGLSFDSEGLLKDTFGVDKDSVSPFALSNVEDLSLIHLVVDNAILALEASTLLAFHPSTADKTVFVTVDQLKSYLASIDKEFIDDDIEERSAKVSNEGEEEDERAPSMGAKSLCNPFEQPKEDPIIPGVTKCVACDHDAKHFMLFGRSY
ncbi:hypothetical protein [Parasitella parasitica]|uniref:Proline-tRNA ligase class II C-terminal domain-containing protein n=1 Tax=Parasitella parasitica TaxID=35722 RepID=A0A0B7MVS7_9FUNG|nr:hypothetical protein [Parasitella parasitica]